MVGDIFGKPGRKAVKELIKTYRNQYELDFVIANGENAAGGNGITREIANELYNAQIDFITMGNHTWDNKEIFQFIDTDKKIIRPANYPPGTPGRGWAIVPLSNGLKIGIINLSGRVFLPPLDCPFRVGERIVEEISKETHIIIVDFHAEATSEKIAMGWFMDGKVSAVVGTHTHVQTADERILPYGTGYITDVGMTGPHDSILGVKRDIVIQKFLTQLPARFETAQGVAQLNAILLEIDKTTGKTVGLKRIQDYL